MMRRTAPLVISVVGLLMALSGCADNTMLRTSPEALKVKYAWLNIEVASLVVTKKTLFDHVATWVTGEDCSSPRAERSEPYCVKWPGPPPPPPEVYCYSSLARPTCYSQAYDQGNDHLIGFVPASITVH
jgi:hypothetical protein